MSDDIYKVMRELNSIRDLVHQKKHDYSHSNLIHHSITELDVILATLDNDFVELDRRLTEFHNNLSGVFLRTILEMPDEK